MINLFFHQAIYSHWLLMIPERLIFACFFAFIILEQAFCENSPFNLSALKLMAYLGKRSYGLYCYHGVIITFFIKMGEKYKLSDSFAEVFFINPVVLFICTVIVAVISYHYFEMPLLKMKNKFYPVQ